MGKEQVVRGGHQPMLPEIESMAGLEAMTMRCDGCGFTFAVVNVDFGAYSDSQSLCGICAMGRLCDYLEGKG